MPGGSGGRAPRESADLKKAHKRGTTHRVECEPTHSAGPLRVTSESLLRSVEPPRSRWHRTHSPQPTRSEVSPAPHAPSQAYRMPTWITFSCSAVGFTHSAG